MPSGSGNTTRLVSAGAGAGPGTGGGVRGGEGSEDGVGDGFPVAVPVGVGGDFDGLGGFAFLELLPAGDVEQAAG